MKILEPLSAPAFLHHNARGLSGEDDLAALVDEIKHARIVMLGEASHGTHEFYDWRRRISLSLLRDHGFRFLAVEGDWPACFAVNRYARDDSGASTARQALAAFRRWPTWMWANSDVLRLLDDLKALNASRPPGGHVHFFGLDIYSLFESMSAVLAHLEKIDPFLARKARRRYACFEPLGLNEKAYADSTLKLPAGCAAEVATNLRDLLERRFHASEERSLETFSTEQNARVAANAEHYYRHMMRGDTESWNIRDGHMMETLANLLEHFGPESRAVVWAHNTHVGDYRATDMTHRGQVNLGGLAREMYGREQVALVGFSSYEGAMIASDEWEGATLRMELPPAGPGSVEAVFHEAARLRGENVFWIPLPEADSRASPLRAPRGHRAVGVVYHPQWERFGNYVPTELTARYDAFVFVDRSNALDPLPQAFESTRVPETFPLGQ